MDSPFTGALVEQAENLFVRRKSKLLGLAIEEEKGSENATAAGRFASRGPRTGRCERDSEPRAEQGAFAGAVAGAEQRPLQRPFQGSDQGPIWGNGQSADAQKRGARPF